MINPHPNSSGPVSATPQGAGPMTLEELTRIYNRKGAEIYVIIEDRTMGLRLDPSLHRPWSNLNRKLAEDFAKKLPTKHSVVTLEDAILLYGRLERQRTGKRKHT